MSVWRESAALPGYEPLRGTLRTDVLVIGGGLAGLLCAYRLRQAGVDCAVVEARTICGGVTGNTTAKITAQHGLIYHQLLRRLGRERAMMYLRANQEALEQYRRMCRSIDCDFQEREAWVYALRDRRALEREMEALWELGAAAEFTERPPLPFPTAGAVGFPRQAQFHPLKFGAAVAKELTIYEHTPVRALAPHLAETDEGAVTAEKIVVATHFPFLNKHGSYFLKLYQHRSYVIALKNAPEMNGMYVDQGERGLSFRNYQGLLLLGGGSHRTGKQGGGWRELRAFAEKYYPFARETAHWATQDCMSLDGVPYIGPYSAGTSGLYVAAGFNKWGMTSAMAAADILTDQILGRENACAEVFSPSRTMLRPQLAVNAGAAAVNLLTPTVPRCPHMGCALKWNRQERSWDCPCHGSRFGPDGGLLENPAAGGLPKPPEKK